MVVLSSFPLPTEGIRLQQRDTTAHLNNTNLGKGTLYIAEGRLTWISSSNDGFSIEYAHISLHAVSRDLNAFPEECLYLMLDTTIDNNEEDAADNSDPEEQKTTELRFVPEDRGMLDAMFHALSACQALHPDPDDSFSDDDFYDDDTDGDIPVDEANLRMANLCLAQNRASFLVSGDSMTYTAGDMIADRMACRSAEHTQSSHVCRRFCSLCSQEEEACNLVEDELEGCFDDAES